MCERERAHTHASMCVCAIYINRHVMITFGKVGEEFNNSISPLAIAVCTCVTTGHARAPLFLIREGFKLSGCSTKPNDTEEPDGACGRICSLRNASIQPQGNCALKLHTLAPRGNDMSHVVPFDMSFHFPPFLPTKTPSHTRATLWRRRPSVSCVPDLCAAGVALPAAFGVAFFAAAARASWPAAAD